VTDVLEHKFDHRKAHTLQGNYRGDEVIKLDILKTSGEEAFINIWQTEREKEEEPTILRIRYGY